MCGRYSQTRELSTLIARFRLTGTAGELVRRYNIAPTQNAPVVVDGDERRLEMLRWGLIPSWSKDPAIGNRMINARAETLTEKPSFKRLVGKRRCLVLADGFYEWKVEAGGGGKTPMRIALKSREPFSFAGLWDHWKDPEGREIRTFTIVTTQANRSLAQIHDRMPVILNPEDEEAWLDLKVEASRAVDLLRPYPEDELEAYTVSRLVNSPKNDSPECTLPV